MKCIAICASSSAYDKVVQASYTLEKLGYKVRIPSYAQMMKDKKMSREDILRFWEENPVTQHRKTQLIREHFETIAKSDAVLVLNYDKGEKNNYIGANVLMEMGLGFYLNLPVFTVHSPAKDSPYIDEILGMQPHCLGGNLEKIREML